MKAAIHIDTPASRLNGVWLVVVIPAALLMASFLASFRKCGTTADSLISNIRTAI